MNEESYREFRIAKWRDRFFAWLIDFVVVWAGILAIYSILGSVFFYGGVGHLGVPMDLKHYENMWAMHGFWFGSGTSITFFAYWGILEGLSGQSLGKRVLGIRTVSIDGSPISVKQSLINSFGKSFLFAADVFFGLLFTRKKRQRIFNRLSNSMVIKLKEQEEPNISYKMD